MTGFVFAVASVFVFHISISFKIISLIPSRSERICAENSQKTMASNEAASTGPKNQEQIIAEFQHLRNEQRNLVTNITKLEVDLKEHK